MTDELKPTTSEERAELVRLAQAATPGVRTASAYNVPMADTGDYDGISVIHVGDDPRNQASVLYGIWNATDQQEADMRFDAATAPDMILRLCAQVDALEKRNAELERERDSAAEYAVVQMRERDEARADLAFNYALAMLAISGLLTLLSMWEG
jgi:hypothetical protein